MQDSRRPLAPTAFPDSNVMKLNAAGSSVVFTATGIGGDSLAVDAAGNIYMAGSAFYYYPTTPGAYQSFPSLSMCPECFFAATVNQYVTKVDSTGSKLIYSTGVAGNSRTINKGLAVDAAGNAYVTGVAYGSYPWSGTQPNSQLAQPFLTKLDAAGAHALYSIAIGGDFSLSQTAGPQIPCATDNANGTRVGVVAPSQLLTLLGSGLGPETGVAATDYATQSLAGVTVTFDGATATLLYVSSSQINVAVPAREPYLNSQGSQNFTTMVVSVNGVAGSRARCRWSPVTLVSSATFLAPSPPVPLATSPITERTLQWRSMRMAR